MTEEWTALAASLQSPIARRHMAAALRGQGLLDGAHLGGDLTQAMTEIPASRLAGDRALEALDIAIDSIRNELAAQSQRASTCFFVSIAMGVALAVAILWSAVGATAQGGLTTAQVLATLGSTAGGGATFAYYKYVSRQARELRTDLMLLVETPIRRARAKAPRSEAVSVP